MSPDQAAGSARALTLLVTGGEGMLAHALRAEAAVRGHRVFSFSHTELDVTDRASVHRTLAPMRPDAVLYCAAMADVDAAQEDPTAAHAVNAEGAGHVAGICASLGARFVYPSTDYVFPGDADRPYRPDDPVAPLSVYGASKLAGEKAALGAGDALVVRTSWLFGVGPRDFVSWVLKAARAGTPLRMLDDQRTSPTWVADLASMILDLLERDAPAGVYHAANKGDATRFEQARAALELAGLSVPVTPISRADLPLRRAPADKPVPDGSAFTATAARSSDLRTVPWAPRPRYSVLDCSATEAIVGPIPHWRSALEKAIQAGL